MGYYVHNKYDKASVDGLTTIGAGQTLVDYYTDYETYKYLDTSAGFGKVYDALEYITPNSITGSNTGTTDGSHFNFSSSIIIKSIQIGKAQVPTSGLDIPIGTIDPNKSIVLLNGFNNFRVTDRDYHEYGASPVIVGSLSSNILRLEAYAQISIRNNVSYQIVEFK